MCVRTERDRLLLPPTSVVIVVTRDLGVPYPGVPGLLPRLVPPGSGGGAPQLSGPLPGWKALLTAAGLGEYPTLLVMSPNIAPWPGDPAAVDVADPKRREPLGMMFFSYSRRSDFLEILIKGVFF